ncbi:hypothetical protein DSM112329_02098 [Paraconexibacter sp. AEG42_29]|uniref:Sodium:proton antiporter n=1 Tax=Paraconexibacter sp. AEG42_29 TaxID=2997339 RepID=A0AAU7AU83_9ACTN
MTGRGGGAATDSAAASDRGTGSPARDGRDESQLERLDRQFDNLLQELRVMQTGVQVLFAFLLGVPFTNRFTTLDDGQRLLFFSTLLAAGVAVLFLLAPGAWHRALFGQDDKAYVVMVSHRLTIVGLTFVGVSICGVIALIATVMYPGAVAAVVPGVCVALYLLVWCVLPLRRRASLHR